LLHRSPRLRLVRGELCLSIFNSPSHALSPLAEAAAVRPETGLQETLHHTVES
jgi:hypothetical protein